MKGLLATAMLLLAEPASAQWYEWRDANGTVHVTNQVPEVVSEAPPGAAPAEPDRDELLRREARLAERQAHLRLLRRNAPSDAASLELENLLADEVRAEAAGIAALRGGQP